MIHRKIINIGCLCNQPLFSSTVKTEKHNSTSVAVYVERDIVGQQTEERKTTRQLQSSLDLRNIIIPKEFELHKNTFQ